MFAILKFMIFLFLITGLYLAFEHYNKLEQHQQANLKQELKESVDSTKIKSVTKSLGAGIQEEFEYKKESFYQSFKNFVHDLAN